MYTLTIDDHGADTITLHDTPTAAPATLDVYLELAGYNCRRGATQLRPHAIEL